MFLSLLIANSLSPSELTEKTDDDTMALSKAEHSLIPYDDCLATTKGSDCLATDDGRLATAEHCTCFASCLVSARSCLATAGGFVATAADFEATTAGFEATAAGLVATAAGRLVRALALCYLTLHELAPTNPKVSELFGTEHMASFLHITHKYLINCLSYHINHPIHVNNGQQYSDINYFCHHG